MQTRGPSSTEAVTAPSAERPPARGVGTSLEILLATFEGAVFLPALLDSVLTQDDQDFTLRVRDDGSRDATPDILQRYRSKFGDRMTIEPTGQPTGSAKGNFAQLMTRSTADHVLWADQDDIWQPNRVSETRALLQASERARGRDTPTFVFTDVTPTDAQLRPMNSSYFRFKRVTPETVVRSLSQCLVCPPMVGCAAGINRALLDLALPVPIDEVTGHDWWALLLAIAAGEARFSRKSTVLYRLHGGNASSQMATSILGYSQTQGKVSRVRRGMLNRWQQARAVRNRLHPVHHAGAIGVIDAFLQIEKMPPVQRRLALVRGGYTYPDLIRTGAMLALC
jgi:glycosyltransferase involved in cell wall biosynthesis